jgi:hypothetical protein
VQNYSIEEFENHERTGSPWERKFDRNSRIKTGALLKKVAKKTAIMQSKLARFAT